MRQRTFLTTASLFFIACFIGSCVQDNSPKKVDFFEQIQGTWIQFRSFDLIDITTNPPAYDWFEVKNGFTLELTENMRFVYTKYGTCTTGRYEFGPELLTINFIFDCPVELNGKTVNSLLEYVDQSGLEDSILLLEHSRLNPSQKGVFSYLRKVK